MKTYLDALDYAMGFLQGDPSKDTPHRREAIERLGKLKEYLLLVGSFTELLKQEQK